MKGFTLIEVLITLVISSIVGTLLITMLVQNNGLFSLQQANVAQGLNLNDATTQISNDIRSSNGVVAGYPIASPTTLSTTESLVVSVPSIDSANNIIQNTYDYIAIVKDSQNNILREIVYPDPASSRRSSNRVLVKDLSVIRFYYLNSSGVAVSPAQAVKVNFVINSTTNLGTKTQQSSSSAQVILRNI